MAQKKQTKKNSSQKAPVKAKAKQPAKGKGGKAAKPSLWQRFVNYLRGVRSEMQRVVWPTRRELINASLVVVGALVFFGVIIAIIDNIIIIPLDWIADIGS